MTTNLRHQLISAVGAVLVSLTFIGAAVGPARAAKAAPTQAAQHVR